jgi:hypothetical protein
VLKFLLNHHIEETINFIGGEDIHPINHSIKIILLMIKSRMVILIIHLIGIKYNMNIIG